MAGRREAVELVEVGNDVYACLQEDTGLGKSNSGLVNRAGGLVSTPSGISPTPAR